VSKSSKDLKANPHRTQLEAVVIR